MDQPVVISDDSEPESTSVVSCAESKAETQECRVPPKDYFEEFFEKGDSKKAVVPGHSYTKNTGKCKLWQLDVIVTDRRLYFCIRYLC
jgi:hypothetical protein